MDKRYSSFSRKSSLSKNKEKLFFVLLMTLGTPIFLTNCTTDSPPSTEETVTGISKDTPSPPVPAGKPGVDAASQVPPESATPAIPPEDGFWNRSIDEVIDSVNSPETDRKLREDASLDRKSVV